MINLKKLIFEKIFSGEINLVNFFLKNKVFHNRHLATLHLWKHFGKVSKRLFLPINSQPPTIKASFLRNSYILCQFFLSPFKCQKRYMNWVKCTFDSEILWNIWKVISRCFVCVFFMIFFSLSIKNCNFQITLTMNWI